MVVLTIHFAECAATIISFIRSKVIEDKDIYSCPQRIKYIVRF